MKFTILPIDLGSTEGGNREGELKFCFQVQGGGHQQCNCMGVYLCCLPATLVQEIRTLLQGKWNVLCIMHI